MAEQAEAQERGLNVSVGGGQQGTGELQGILVQVGRIADTLAEIAKALQESGAQKPQPFSQASEEVSAGDVGTSEA